MKDQGLVSCFVSKHWQVCACVHMWQCMCVCACACAHVCMPLCVYMYVFVCLVLWYLYNWKKNDGTLRELWWTTEVITDILVWTWTWQMWSRSKSTLYLFPNWYLWSITKMAKERSMKNGHLEVRAKKTMQGWLAKQLCKYYNKKETKVPHRAQSSHMQWAHKENMYYMHGEQCEKKS